MLKKINAEKICPIIFVASVFMVSFAPYQLNSTLTLHSNFLLKIFKLILYVFLLINTVLIIPPYFKRKKIFKINFFQIIPIIIFFALSTFHTYGNNFNFTGILTMLQCVIFALSNDEIKLKTFKYLKNVLFVVCCLGIICFISYLLKLFLPYSIVDYYNGESFAKYVDYKFIFLYTKTSSNSIRLCGVFNEPGLLGTICSLVLSAGNFNLKDRKNIILLLAGLLTFSLAFIIIIAAYLLLKYIRKKKTILIILFSGLFFLLILPNISTGINSIDNLINRLTITKNGLVGDNRNSEDLNLLLKDSIENKPFLGYGNGYLNTKTLKPFLSYKSYVIQYGILGCLLIWGTLFFAATYKRKNNFNVILFVIVFFLSIYQRPHIMTLMFQLILYGGVLYVEENSSIKKI